MENYSDKYLQARAAMLSWVVYRNEQDNTDATISAGSNQLYRDYGAHGAKGITQIRTGDVYTGDENRARFLFGGALGDELSGGTQSDALFGGAGGDTLRGAEGNDHLEGNAGDDWLVGGNGQDKLYGGQGKDSLEGGEGSDDLFGGADDDTLEGDAGEDTLEGGAGNDKLDGGTGYDILLGGADNDRLNGGDFDRTRDDLIGGAGFDTYVLKKRNGWDRIIDADGSGKLEMDGATASGGKERNRGSKMWFSADRLFTYRLIDHEGQPTLLVYGPGYSKAAIKGFVNGQLGISLIDGDDPDHNEPNPDLPIPDGTDNNAQGGQDFAPRADPLVLDLDGDGLEVQGINLSAPIYFDNDADSIVNPTGWVRPDDGLLVMDRNGNGTIDSGAELFGDATPLNSSGSMDRSGGVAPNGYAALVKEDSNLDGKVDASDARWSRLRVWQDSNQDGVSQSAELKTLSSLGIQSIATGATVVNRTLSGGNLLLQAGSYTRTDGSARDAGTVQEVGEFNFAQDTFRRRFTDSVPVLTEVKPLPNMLGSGRVRDLHEAASLNNARGVALKGTLAAFASADGATQAQQVNQLIGAWAQTSDLQSTAQRLTAMGHGGKQYALNVTRIGNATQPVVGSPQWPAWEALVNQTLARLDVIGAFTGRHFFDLEGFVQPVPRNEGAIVGLSMSTADRTNNNNSNFVGTVKLNLALLPQQLVFVDQAYAALSEGVFAAMLMQTRGGDLGRLVVSTLTEENLSHDFTALYAEFDARIAANPVNALYDITAFNLGSGSAFKGTGYDGWRRMEELARTVAGTAAGDAALRALSFRLNPGALFVVAPNGQRLMGLGDVLSNSMQGSTLTDYLSGAGGNDLLVGGAGADVLRGGEGDDTLRGDDGDDDRRGGARPR